MGWLFLAGLLVGTVVGYLLVTRKAKPKYLLHMEYWVYLPGESLPPQEAIMAGFLEAPGVGPSEALLFSDVRLHIALVLRSKNAHVFRPDLLAPLVEATQEQLDVLKEAKSFVKVRYISEEPVADRRHLAFLPQVARVVASLGWGRLVYDPVGERLLTPEELSGGDPGPNVRWVPEPSGGHVETLGLKKLGLAEIRTAPIAADERWIVSEVMGQVAREAWKGGVLPPMALAEAFHDRFRVDLADPASARVHRIQEV